MGDEGQHGKNPAVPVAGFGDTQLLEDAAHVRLHGAFREGEWVRGSTAAFPAEVTDFDALPYGIVNLLIFAVGLGLVWLGHRLGSRRREPQAVDLAG
jgi:hypothetical protein